MSKKREKITELDLLEKLSNMTEDELKEFRKQNRKHDREIAQRKKRNLLSELIKRIVDLFAGIIGTILLIPLTILVWLMKIIKKEDGPIFYDQLRIGKNGKVFKMYKFRTMVVGADDILEEYLKENKAAAEEYKINKKLKNDPRITKVGKFLRDTSLDEWPQFIHVLSGKMSLVGPRPYLPREKKDMGVYYKFIIKMKPGVTGPWQIAGRNNLTFEDRLMLDEEYCARRGNRRDFKILMKTAKKVIKREGAE